MQTKAEPSVDFAIYLIYFRPKCATENTEDIKLFRLTKL